jgi:hypothetical protein
MSTTCRDCGNVLAPGARGCQRCALNLEAENMIGRFLWKRAVPGLILLSLIIVIVIAYMVR